MAAKLSFVTTSAIAAIALTVIAVDPALAYGGTGMMGGGTTGAMAGFGFFGLLWPLLILGGLLALVYWAVGSGNGGGRPTGSNSALETLRERYARGELTDNEFEERRRRLER